MQFFNKILFLVKVVFNHPNSTAAAYSTQRSRKISYYIFIEKIIQKRKCMLLLTILLNKESYMASLVLTASLHQLVALDEFSY